MGMVRTYAFEMQGIISADAGGATLSISQNPALFTLFGSFYGGNGQTNFALPDLAGTITVGPSFDLPLGSETGVGQLQTDQPYLPGTWGGAGLQQSNEQPSLALTTLIQVGPSRSELGSAGEMPIGTIRQFGGTFPPKGHMVADGRELAITSYPELYAKIGTTYGGDGINSFRIPDLSGKAIVGVSDGLQVGDVVGQDLLTIDDSEMPTVDGGGGQSVDNRQSSVVMDFLIRVEGIFPSEGILSGEYPVVGEVITTAAPNASAAGWMPAHGQLLQINQHMALFSLLGTQFGGDGQTTFALPDMRGRVVVGSGVSQDLGTLAIGQTGGSNSVALTDADIPPLVIDGTSGADTRHGAGKDDVINGNDGNDTLSGHGGNDRMNGGTGTNTMAGGSGADVFTVGAGNDTINDFTRGQDKLQGSVFDGVATLGDLLAFVDKTNHQDMVFTFPNGNTLTLKGVDWEDFSLSDVNLAPAITSGDGASTASYDIAENASNVVVPFAAVDGNGDRITYTLSGDDQTRFSINQTTGELTLLGTPDFEAPADLDRNNTYEVVVTVTDAGGLTDSQAITVRVTDTNEKPTLSATALDPTLIENGAPVDLFSSVSVDTVESSQTITELTLTVSGVTDGASETLRIDGTNVLLRAGESGTTAGSASVNYTVTVTNGLATVTITDATGLSAAETRTLVDGLAYGNASDNPGNTDRVVTLTSIRDSGGTDNGGVDKTDLSLAATVHVTPVNDAPDGADKVITLQEDATYTFTAADFGFSDAGEGNGFLALKVTTLPGSGTLVLGDTTGGSAAPTAVMSGAVIASEFLKFLMWQPANNANGNGLASFTFQVIDDGDAAGGLNTDSSPNRITFDVTAVNDAPSFTAGGDQTVSEDAGAQTVNGWASAIVAGPGNEAGQVLSFTVSNDNTALFAEQPTIAADGTLTYKFADNANGVATVRVVLSDDGGTAGGGKDSSDPITFTLTATPVNDAPTDIGFKPMSTTGGGLPSVMENSAGAVIASVFVADIDDATFTYTLDDSRFEIVGDQLKLKAGVALDYEAAQSITVKVTATDSGNQQVTRDVTIAVTDDGRDNNSAPFISTANEDTTVQSGTPLSLLIGDGHFTDPQGTDLDYLILVDGVAKPDWLTFDAETGLLSGTPTSAEAGSYVITVSATDGGLSSPSDEFILVVTNPTAPPDPKGTRRKDTLEGSDFDNIMDGRRGNDKLTGNGGADTFVFGKNYGRDVILDFNPEEGDRIDLSGAVGIKGFQDLMKNHVFDSGDNIKIRADDGSVLIVQGIDPGELTKDMFLF
jgi:microcystin-dependent protein